MRKPTTNMTPAAIHWVHTTRAKPSWSNQSTSVHVRDRKMTTAANAARIPRVQANGPGRRGPSAAPGVGREGRRGPPEPLEPFRPEPPSSSESSGRREPNGAAAPNRKEAGSKPRCELSPSSPLSPESDAPPAECLRGSLRALLSEAPSAPASSDWKKPPRTRSSRLDGEESPGAERSGLSSDSSSGLVLTVTLRVVAVLRNARECARTDSDAEDAGCRNRSTGHAEPTKPIAPLACAVGSTHD